MTLSLLPLLSLVVACDGGKKDEDDGPPQDNLTCESECISESVAEVSDCFEEETACIAACGGFSDSACVDSCGEAAFGCTRGIYFCVAGCSCFQELDDCLTGCADLECFEVCGDGYDACAGENSPFNCRLDCDNVRFDCTTACEASATSAAELGACMEPCDAAYRPCHAACAE